MIIKLREKLLAQERELDEWVNAHRQGEQSGGCRARSRQ
jgi:hypothetical protein